MKSVTSSDFQVTPGVYHDQALREPLSITKYGRKILVLLAADEYERLKSRDRRVFLTEDMPAEDIEALMRAHAAPEAAAYDHEVEG